MLQRRQTSGKIGVKHELFRPTLAALSPATPLLHNSTYARRPFYDEAAHLPFPQGCCRVEYRQRPEAKHAAVAEGAPLGSSVVISWMNAAGQRKKKGACKTDEDCKISDLNPLQADVREGGVGVRASNLALRLLHGREHRPARQNMTYSYYREEPWVMQA